METANLTTSSEKYSASEHETKFVLNNSAAGTIIRWLQCRCRLDDRFEAGIVSSIYYDTHKWRFLSEKINSDYLKTKIRLRWYSDIDSGESGDDSFIDSSRVSGSGKNTLLSLVGGLEQPSYGSIVYKENDFGKHLGGTITRNWHLSLRKASSAPINGMLSVNVGSRALSSSIVLIRGEASSASKAD